MRNKFLLNTLKVVVVGAVAFFWPTLMVLKDNERRNAARSNLIAAEMDVPQAERALRVPSPQKINQSLTARAAQILKQSPKLTLFSVKTKPYCSGTKTCFQEHEILGKTVITDSEAKSALLASFYDGLVPLPGTMGVASCFSPRHGLRATSNGQTVDVLICFHCHQFNVYLDNKEVATTQPITAAPQPMFNQILTDANISIAP